MLDGAHRRCAVVALALALMLGAASPGAAARTPRSARVNLTVEDAPIRDVLTFLAREGGVNIVMTAAVRGAVTIHLERVRVVDALRAVVRVHGYALRVEDGVIAVMTRAEAERWW